MDCYYAIFGEPKKIKIETNGILGSLYDSIVRKTQEEEKDIWEKCGETPLAKFCFGMLGIWLCISLLTDFIQKIFVQTPKPATPTTANQQCRGVPLPAIPQRTIRQNGPFGYREVQVIESEWKVDQAVEKLKKRNKFDRIVLGMSCEWTSPKKVALLQLAADDNYCALFRFCCFNKVAESLQLLLEDPSILKVGVDPKAIAENLNQEYCIAMKGTFDIRHMATNIDLSAMDLRKMAIEFLNVKMERADLFWDWDMWDLDEEQIQYASSDVQAAMKLFHLWWETRPQNEAWKIVESNTDTAEWLKPTID